MDPDLAVASAWSSVAEAASWAGLSEPSRSAFFEHFGVHEHDHPRLVAATPRSELDVIINRWCGSAGSDDSRATRTQPAEINRLRLFVRACRVACGLVGAGRASSAQPAACRKRLPARLPLGHPVRKRLAQAEASASSETPRCSGRVESWCPQRRCGFLRYHPAGSDHAASVFCRSSEFSGLKSGAAVAAGDHVEFTLGRDERGACAVRCVRVAGEDRRAPARQCVDLEAMRLLDLSEAAAAVGEEAERQRREGEVLQSHASISEGASLRGVASIYVAAVREFAEHQLIPDVLRAELANHLQRRSGHADADATVQSYEMALREMGSRRGHLDATLIRSLHERLAGLTNGRPGEWRASGVRAGSSVFPDADKVPAAVDIFCQNLCTVVSDTRASAAARAAWALYWFTAIHPFGDGNGRVGRIIANWVLHQCGVPFICHFCVSAEQRDELVAALKAGHACGGKDLSRLVTVVASAMVRGFRELQMVVERHRSAATADLADSAVRSWREGRRAESCLICLDDNPNMATLCCGQPLHLHCLQRALSSGTSSRCPSCRQDMPRPVPEVPRTPPLRPADMNEWDSVVSVTSDAYDVEEPTPTGYDDSMPTTPRYELPTPDVPESEEEPLEEETVRFDFNSPAGAELDVPDEGPSPTSDVRSWLPCEDDTVPTPVPTPFNDGFKDEDDPRWTSPASNSHFSDVPDASSPGGASPLPPDSDAVFSEAAAPTPSSIISRPSPHGAVDFSAISSPAETDVAPTPPTLSPGDVDVEPPTLSPEDADVALTAPTLSLEDDPDDSESLAPDVPSAASFDAGTMPMESDDCGTELED